MGGYLETYRAGEEHRHKIIKWLVGTVLVLLILAAILYFTFRNYKEEQKIRGFLEALRGKNYTAAYQFWGCDAAKPCHDYDYRHFLEDWGPASKHADIAQGKLTKTKTCSTGVIQVMDFPGETINLWVDSKTLVIGFAPWPVCNPRMQVDVPQ